MNSAALGVVLCHYPKPQVRGAGMKLYKNGSSPMIRCWLESGYYNMPIVIGSGITVGPGITINSFTPVTVVTSFTSNGTFSVPSGRTITTARMLLVGGGGAGGNPVSSAAYYAGGGGGAGGLIANVDLTTAIAVNTNYTIVVGAGGLVPTVGNTSNGANSTAFGYTAVGGGGGGSTTVGIDGGSGGGANGDSADLQSGGNSIQNSSTGYGVGFAGSINFNAFNDQHSGGAGGGAGGAGTAAVALTDTTATLSVGGVGIYDNISGTNTYYAQGGSGAYRRDLGINVIYGVQSATPGGGGGGGFNTVGATDGQTGICVISYTYF